MAGVGHLQRMCKDAFRVAGAVQETCPSEMLGGRVRFGASNLQFWENDFVWQVQHLYDLASLFRGRRNTSETRTGKIAKRIGTRPSSLHSTFHFWRTSHRVASFLMLSTSKNEEVSQNCFIFDVVKFKNYESLAELLRFWCCQVQNLRKPRRIASFLTLSNSKVEDVSQNFFVSDVVKFKSWGSLAE